MEKNVGLRKSYISTLDANYTLTLVNKAWYYSFCFNFAKFWHILKILPYSDSAKITSEVVTKNLIIS